MKRLLSIGLLPLLLIAKSYAQISVDTAAIVKTDKQLYAIVVSQNDKIVYQHFFNGKGGNDLFSDQSLTKSVVSLLIGIAIEKGYIKSTDEKIADFFPGLKQDTDKRKQDITVTEIMNQASGLWHEDLGFFGNIGKYLKFANQSGYVLNAPLGTQPGKVFHYSNAASHLLSVILTKSTGMPTLEFAQKYLFGPLGITNVDWKKMKDGYYDGSGLLGLYLSTADMNKIGTLLLHKGQFNNQPVMPEKWVAELLDPTLFYHTDWGFAGSTYGLCFYHYTYKNTPVTYGLGWGGQYIFVIPGKNAVITVNESTHDGTAIKAGELFLGKIFPLIYAQLGGN